MKKKYLFGILFSLVAAAGVTSACSSQSSIKVNFKKDEYTLSVGEGVDFSDEIKIHGAGKQDIVLSSSNKDLIDLEEGIFKAKDSGHAYILAKYNSILVGQVKVKIKYKFSSPQNFSISQNGVLTWDKSFAMVNGQVVNAKSYAISYGLVNDGETVYQNVVTNANKFTFTSGRGVYDIKVQALAHSDDFDPSDIIEQEINYGAMGHLENVSLTNNAVGGTAVLSWKAKENALYDVFVEGIKVKSNLNTNSFTYNYDAFPTAQRIGIEIIAKPDETIEALETATQLSLTKPNAPTLSYENGKLVIGESANAVGYKLQDDNGNSIELGQTRESILEGMELGVYNFRAMATGSQGDGLVLNSGFSERVCVGKLPIPKFDITMDGNLANVTFGERVYQENYRVFYGAFGDKSYDITKTQADPIDLSSYLMNPGAYTINVQASPSASSVITLKNGATTTNVLNSDVASYTIYKLESIGTIKHALNGTTSQISFAAVENATDYKLYVNGNKTAITDFSEEGGEIKFTIPDINTIMPVDGKYSFKVEAYTLNEDGKLISTTSEKTKEVAILPLTEKTVAQVNGYFSWKPVMGATYRYQVFKANKQGLIEQETPVQEGTLAGVQTLSALPVGYYRIKIVSMTTDENLYLDSDFADANNCYDAHFAVTDQIAAPGVELIEDGNEYKLKITLSEFAGEYTIKINGVEDGSLALGEDLYSQGQQTAYYTIKHDFQESKDYTLSVVAKAGALFDEGINLASQPTTISVTRLPQVQYSIDLQKDGFGRIAGQALVCGEIENSVAMEAVKGDTPIEMHYSLAEKTYSIDLSDVQKFGSSFELTLKNIAKEKDGDHYYLDSIEKTFNFARVETPTNVAYADGKLTFNSDDENVEKYLVCITTVENIASAGEPVYSYFYHAFETASTSVDIQQKIEQLCRQNANFETAYKQMDYTLLSVKAIANSEKSGVHYIPSADSLEEEVCDLSPVTLSFDRDTQTLSWAEGAIAGSKFDLYINGLQAMTNLENTSTTLAEITGINLSSVQSISVVSKHSKFFDSKESNTIKIKQLDCAKTLSVSKNGDDYVGVVNITSDNTSISKVLVGGQEATLSASAANANFEILTEGQQKVQLIAKEEMVDGVYYLNSEERTFSLAKLGEITASVNGDNIVWNSPSDGIMKKADVNPYEFELVFRDGSTVATYTTNNTQIAINDIETLFNLDLNDDTQDFTIDVKVVFKNPYILTIDGNDAVGLFGESQTATSITAHKIHTIDDASILVCDGLSTNEVQKKMESTVEISFSDYWSEFTGVKFNVKVGNRILSMNAEEGGILGICKLSYNEDDSRWIFSINTSIFKEEQTSVELSVACPGNITSDVRTLTIDRYAKVGGLLLSPEGILTIQDSQEGASYALSITQASTVLNATFTQEEVAAIDLTTDQWLGKLTAGDYTISVVAYDEECKILPSLEILTKTEHQFAGIQNAYIDEEGKIVLAILADNFTNAVFTAKTTVDGEEYTKNFSPIFDRVDGTGENALSYYWLTIPEAIALFEDDLTQTQYNDYSIFFTVRSEDGINSPWKNVEFTYSQGEEAILPQMKRADYDKDYIIVPLVDNQTVHAIRVKTLIADGSENIIYYSVAGENLLSDIAGCWIEGVNGGRFSSVDDALSGESSQECYAISINSILEDAGYGDYSIEVFVVTKDAEENYIQYQPNAFAGYKLCTIYDGATTSSLQALEIKNGYLLQWQWKQDDDGETAKPATAYYVVITDGINETKFFTEVPVYDLRTCGLTAGVQYYVSVVAVSESGQVLASNPSTEIEATQYVKPLAPTVIDGKLGYDFGISAAEEGTLLGDIAAYFEGRQARDYQETIALEREMYYNPFTAATSSIEQAKIRLKFTQITETNSYGSSYYITVAAKDLLLDAMINGGQDSYYNMLAIYYLDRMQINNLNETAQKFITQLLFASRGLATDETLFDDVGGEIPKGTYEVSFVQVGGGKFIESAPTSACRVYLSAGASVELKIEDLEKKNQYMAVVSPNKTATSTDGITFVEKTATNYRMLLRGYDSSKTRVIKYNLDFAYDGNNWNGEFMGVDLNSLTGLGTVVYTISASQPEDVPSFKINMSLLRFALNEILTANGENQLDSVLTYQVDIYALSNGDKGVLNGKSGKFTLVYQDIDVANIKLEKGAIVLPSTAPGNLSIRYAYNSNQNTIFEETSSIVAGNNKVDFSCIENGSDLYFVSFSLQGAISYSRMQVESDVYGIANPYKLSQPTISTINNNLRFVYSQNDLNEGVVGYMDGAITYVVKSNKLTEYKAEATTNQVDYSPGSIEGEAVADSFSAHLLGNSGSFIRLSEGDQYYSSNKNYDHQLVLADEYGNIMLKGSSPYRIIFSSKEASINAKMLDYGVSGNQTYQLSQGSLYFTLPIQETTGVVDSQGQNANVIYKVLVDYYTNVDPGVASTPSNSEILYFTQDYVQDGKLIIDGQLINRERPLASFTASVVMAKKATAAEANIQTVDGQYYSTADSFTYSDGSYVLRTAQFSPNDSGVVKRFGHPPAVIEPASVGQVLIYNGKINFLLTKDTAFSNLAQREIIVEVKNNSDARYITGECEKQEISGNLLVSFTPNDFEDEIFLNSLKGTSFSVNIMNYTADSLLSLPFTLTNVYKLPDIAGRYEVKVASGNNSVTCIDFSNYFERFSVSGNRFFYQIVVTATYDGGVKKTTLINASDAEFILESGIKSLEIQAVDTQQSNTVNRVKIFNGDVFNIQVQSTEYQAAITWQSDRVGFQWDGGEPGKEYEYFYSIEVQDPVKKDNLGNYVIYAKQGTTRQNFYGPEHMGDVVSFALQARVISGGEENTIYIFSDAISAEEEQLNKGLYHYAGGSGTQNDPYLIQSIYNSSTGQVVAGKSALDQFKAISVRNNEGVYFKLMEDIIVTLNDAYAPIDLKANIIGNGRTITVIADSAYEMANGYNVKNVIRGTEYTFGKYSALFNTIAPSSTISKLNIAYEINCDDLNNDTVAFAPIALFNYGKLQEVTVKSINVNYIGGEGTNKAFIAGLVVSNFGKIISCVNNANVNYSASSELSVASYAPIALFNDSKTLNSVSYVGEIFGCVNNGDINVSIVAEGTTVIVGGIVVKNGSAKIYASQNNGDIDAQPSNANRRGIYYLGGLAATNQKGTIHYCYNNGQITYGNGTGYVAAIVHLISGDIKGVVEVSGVLLAYYSGTTGVISQNNYIQKGLNQGAILSGVNSFENSLTIETPSGEEVEFNEERYHIVLTITLGDGSLLIPSISITKVG